jgi:hypothetical protein
MAGNDIGGEIRKETAQKRQPQIFDQFSFIVTAMEDEGKDASERQRR